MQEAAHKAYNRLKSDAASQAEAAEQRGNAAIAAREATIAARERALAERVAPQSLGPRVF